MKQKRSMRQVYWDGPGFLDNKKIEICAAQLLPDDIHSSWAG